MKKFNEIISVEVLVDSIANKLLQTMDKENPHAELITETTIGLLLHRGGLGFLLQSLNGWKEEINIEPNTVYLINGKDIDLPSFDEQRNLTETGLSPDSMFEVKIAQVQPFKDGPKKVEVIISYWRRGSDRATYYSTWVDHTKLKARASQVELA